MAHAGRAVIDRQGEADAGRSGVTWTPSFLLLAPANAHLLTTTASGRRYCLRQSCVRPERPSGCAQLHGGAVTTSLFLCRANRKLPFFKSLMGAAPARFHFAGQYSVRETNAQPAPATGLFKGFGTLAQQAKTDFRRPRRKSVLSICGNKCPACNFGECPKMRLNAGRLCAIL